MTSVSWTDCLRDAEHDPTIGLLDVEVTEEMVDGRRIGVAELRFAAVDMRGGPYVARAKMLLPAVMKQRLPVWFTCGYELPDDLARQQVLLDRIVVSPCDPTDEEVFPYSNPLCRGPNTDYALAHIVRGLPFIDPARIVYSGGSAGGYTALLVAAEAFPAAAAVPNAPVVNLSYQGAFFRHNVPQLAAEPPAEAPLVGVLMSMFLPFMEQGWERGYGPDVAAPSWYEHSPVAHLPRITCPVAAFFSTADFLVPIEQVGADVAAATLADLPDRVVMSASALSSSPQVGQRLLDLLGDAAEVQVVPVPETAAAMSLSDLDVTMTRPQDSIEVHAKSTKPWQVVVVDEGPTVFGAGHTRHLIQPEFEPFAREALQQGVTIEQLTAAKMEQLLMRWRGIEWLAQGFRHLDETAAEQADVERGLRVYCAQSAAHAQRFSDLYDVLDAEWRVLPERLVAELLS